MLKVDRLIQFVKITPGVRESVYNSGIGRIHGLLLDAAELASLRSFVVIRDKMMIYDLWHDWSPLGAQVACIISIYYFRRILE